MTFWDIVKIFAVLLILMGVMYMLLFLVKKYLYTFDKRNSKIFNINVLTTQAIMPKKFISVVRVHDKLFVLGVSDNAINLIDKLDDFTAQTEHENYSNNQPHRFFDYLKRNMVKK